MTTAKPSPLSRALQSKPAAPVASRFAQAITGARVVHYFTIPRLELPAVMTLVSTDRVVAIEADVTAHMAKLGLELNATTELHYELERAARMLAEAVLDPGPVALGDFAPIGTLNEWRSADPDVIGDCWRIYADVRGAYDPVGAPLSQEDLALIEEAIKKKNPTLLRYCGARRLASYLLTTADLQSASAPPTSSASE